MDLPDKRFELYKNPKRPIICWPFFINFATDLVKKIWVLISKFRWNITKNKK